MDRGFASYFVRIAIALIALSPLGARALCFSQAPDASAVTETYDAASDRYYSSWTS